MRFFAGASAEHMKETLNMCLRFVLSLCIFLSDRLTSLCSEVDKKKTANHRLSRHQRNIYDASLRRYGNTNL